MYFIIFVFTIVVIFYYWDALYEMFAIFNTMSTPSFNIINPWFIGLLVINILCFIFLRWLYYNRKNAIGKIGNSGDQGLPGYTGSECKLPCK